MPTIGTLQGDNIRWRLIRLNKCPCVRPVGLGETWWWLLMKCVLEVTGVEDKEAYGTEQLRRGMGARTEGGIYVLRLLWQQHDQKEDWGFLLIDVHHALNREN